jgi:TatD DNase family protein
MMLNDAHCHLQFPVIRDRIGDWMHRARSEGLGKFVVNGTCPEDWESVIQLGKEYPEQIIPAIGLHPWKVKLQKDHGWKEKFVQLLDSHPHLAVGEIGLDRWIKQAAFAQQKESFSFQLEHAAKRNLPISIHCLRAWESLIEVLSKSTLPQRGIHIHAFGGSLEVWKTLETFSPYYSFNGYFLQARKAEVAEIFKKVPGDRILVETDAPEMLPPPIYILEDIGDWNSIINLKSIAGGLALLRDTSLSELTQQMNKNFERYFTFSRNICDF